MDRSSDDPCPEAKCLSRHSGQINSTEAKPDPHMLTRGPEEFRQYSHMTTETQEGIPYCSLSTSGSDPYVFLRKMKKTRSTREERDGKVFFSARFGIFFL